MSGTELSQTPPGIVQADDGSIQILTVSDPDGIEIIARLRETHGDARGRAFVINLDQIIVRLGARWEAKEALVREHLKRNFSVRFQEPNWCAQILENVWLASTITASARSGALQCEEIWKETAEFFVGDITDTKLPLYEVRVEDATRLRLKRIDIKTYYDRGEAFAPETHTQAPIASSASEETTRTAQAVGHMVAIHRPHLQNTTISIGGRTLRVACGVEPVFELKTLSLIGHRLEPQVIDATGNVLLDSKALKGMDWGDREKVDLANIEEGMRLMRSRNPSQRKVLLVVPVAFSTLASGRGRARATAEVSRAAAEMGMKVLYEIRGLSGVPSHRILDIISMIKPYCMAAVGHVGSELRAVQAVRQCGFSGVCLTYDGVERPPELLEEYLKDLSLAARSAAGACMIQGFDNLRQMAIARLAGVSHASVKTSSLLTPGARSSNLPSA